MKKRIRFYLPFIIAIGIYAFLTIADSCFFKGRHQNMICRISFCCIIIIAVINLLIELRYLVICWLKRYAALLFIILLSIIIPIIVHFIVYRNDSIKQSDFLNFYGSYLTFLGAFSLGYYLHKKDEQTQLSVSNDCPKNKIVSMRDKGMSAQDWQDKFISSHIFSTY